MPRSKKEGIEKYTLRLYDGFDNHWVDCFDAIGVSYEEALKKWNEETANGTRNTQYKDGDYYDIFPADTRMLY